MASTIRSGAPSNLAGSYFNWEAEGTPTVTPSVGGIVAVPATHDWGPLNVAVLLQDLGEFRKIFGAAIDTPLFRAVYGAFKGDINGGAGAVLAIRQGTTAADFAKRLLVNTGAVTALTLTALYAGTRGNDFRITIQPSAVGGKSELILLDGALVVEKYTYTTAFDATSAAALAAEINRASDWVSATVGTTGTALTPISAQALAGGNDGTGLAGGDWLALQDTLDAERWSAIAAHGLTDSAVRAAMEAWIEQRNTLGQRSRAVFGGVVGEDLATANARSVALNNWDVVNIGVGSLFLDDLGINVSTSEFVSRVAGAIVNRGETRDMIYVRFPDVTLTDAPTRADEEDALAAGTTVFSRDTNVTAPVFIREGVTTYTDDSQSPVDDEGNKTHPVEQYKRIKNLSIQHGVELEVNDWATAGGVLGDLPVNDRVRAQVLGFIATLYQRREDAEIIQPGWTVLLDPTVPVSDDDDFVAYLHGWHPTRSLRQMVHRARIG